MCRVGLLHTIHSKASNRIDDYDLHLVQSIVHSIRAMGIVGSSACCWVGHGLAVKYQKGREVVSKVDSPKQMYEATGARGKRYECFDASTNENAKDEDLSIVENFTTW